MSDAGVPAMKNLPLLSLLSLAPVLASGAAVEIAKRPPNVVIILIDDMGWNDIGANGSRFCKTPNIDRLAAEGMRFTQGYSSSAVCSPSRAGLLTGQNPARLHVTDWIPGNGPRKDGRFDLPVWTQRLDPKIPNLAETLSARGYVTASIGKWHLGGEGSMPQDCGFSVNVAGGHIGHPASYFWPYGKPGSSHKVPGLESGGKEGEYLTDRLTDEAIRFMDANRDKPFFLYLPHYAVHDPLMAKGADVSVVVENTPGLSGDSNKTYAAMVKSVDESVGRVCSEISRLGLAKDTIVIFSSDNGGVCHYKGGATWAHPLRGGKGFPYEGGIRVPFIVKAPGVTVPGSVSDAPTLNTDWHATLATLCGAKAPAKTDGVDITPALRGEKLPVRDMGWNFPHYWSGKLMTPYSVLRSGDWKIIRWYEYESEELYNLASDPGERTDLASSNPAKLREMHGKLDAWLKANDAQTPVLRKGAGPAPDPRTNPALKPDYFAEPGK